MTLIEHTAYPRLKRTLTPKELDQIYTPTPAELLLARRTAKGPVATLSFLVHLKVFQRLGYAVFVSTRYSMCDFTHKLVLPQPR